MLDNQICLNEFVPEAIPTPTFSFDSAGPISALLVDVTLSEQEMLAPQIFRLLRDLIVTLQLVPGQRLSEKEISDGLGASKTPVREALIRLEDAGLVNVIPKSGTYVTPIRIATFIEGCFTRIQLEIGAVRRAAERSKGSFTSPDFDAILDEQQCAMDAVDDAEFFRLDQKLHAAIFQAAGVPGAWDVLTRSQLEVNRLRHLKRIRRIRRHAKVIADHRAIVQAILDSDPDAAEAALVAHIGSLEGEIAQLSSDPELLRFIESQSSLPRGGR